MWILFSLLSALAAPKVTVVPRSDGESYVLRNGVIPVDAWSFASHYDPGVRTSLRGKVYGRRLLFFQGLLVGGVTTTAAIIWAGANGNSRTRGVDPGPYVMGLSGGLLVALTIPLAVVVKARSLRPQRHWTMEEASVLAAGGRITHGLQIVPTNKGWTVVNRAGRPLSPIEIASRLGDRNTLRKAKAQNLGANVISGAAMGAGYVGIIGGLSMASDSGAKSDWRLTGAGAMAAGTGLIIAGVVGRVAASHGQSAARYWSREELQNLLDLP